MIHTYFVWCVASARNAIDKSTFLAPGRRPKSALVGIRQGLPLPEVSHRPIGLYEVRHRIIGL